MGQMFVLEIIDFMNECKNKRIGGYVIVVFFISIVLYLLRVAFHACFKV